jgi:hypothetical protein
MPIEAGATYVFDLGCYDYGGWAKMDAAGCRIVTRCKSNTPLAVTAQWEVPEGAPDILSDRIGLLPQRHHREHSDAIQPRGRDVRRDRHAPAGLAMTASE